MQDTRLDLKTTTFLYYLFDLLAQWQAPVSTVLGLSHGFVSIVTFHYYYIYLFIIYYMF